MADNILPHHADRTQLQQIITGLPEGVIIINPDQTIAWSNDAALKMHGVQSLEELGSNVSEYRERFELRYRNRHKLPPGDYPMERVVTGEAFSEVVVEVGRPGEEKTRTQQIRSMVLTDQEGRPDYRPGISQQQTVGHASLATTSRYAPARPSNSSLRYLPGYPVLAADDHHQQDGDGCDAAVASAGYKRHKRGGRNMTMRNTLSCHRLVPNVPPGVEN